MENIKKLVEGLRDLPVVWSGSLRIDDKLEIRWNDVGGKLHSVYRLEFDNRDWSINLGSRVLESELTYHFLDVEQEQILREVELSLSFLLPHLQTKVQQAGERRQKLKEQIIRLQNELTALSDLNKLEDE